MTKADKIKLDKDLLDYIEEGIANHKINNIVVYQDNESKKAIIEMTPTSLYKVRKNLLKDLTQEKIFFEIQKKDKSKANKIIKSKETLIKISNNKLKIHVDKILNDIIDGIKKTFIEEITSNAPKDEDLLTTLRLYRADEDVEKLKDIIETRISSYFKDKEYLKDFIYAINWSDIYAVIDDIELKELK